MKFRKYLNCNLFSETPCPERSEENKEEGSILNGHSSDETFPPLQVAHVKLEPSKSCIVGCVRSANHALSFSNHKNKPLYSLSQRA